MQTSEEILSSIDILYANDLGHCPMKVSFQQYIGDFTFVSLAELRTNEQRQECISREPNPGHIDGKDVFYH